MEVMDQFYRGIQLGMPKDDALRTAQRNAKVNATSKWEEPNADWAAFVLTGDAGPILESPGSASMLAVLKAIGRAIGWTGIALGVAAVMVLATRQAFIDEGWDRIWRRDQP